MVESPPVRPPPQIIRVPSPFHRVLSGDSPPLPTSVFARSAIYLLALPGVLWLLLGAIAAVAAIRHKWPVTRNGESVIRFLGVGTGALTVGFVLLTLGCLLTIRGRAARGLRGSDPNAAEASDWSCRRRGLVWRILAQVLSFLAVVTLVWSCFYLPMTMSGRRTLLGLSALQAAIAAAVLVAVLGGVVTVIVKLVRKSKRDAAGTGKDASAPHQASPDAAAAQIEREWRGLGAPPAIPRIQEAVALLEPSDPPRARVVCLGDFDIPESGDVRFEPEVIWPTRMLLRRVVVAFVILALVAAWWILALLGLIPAKLWGANPMFSMGYLVFPPLVLWVWRAGVRPVYIRMAPGIVQALEYKWPWTRMPKVRHYPMESGTLAIMWKATEGMRLTLVRGANKDVIKFGEMTKGKDALERAWQALLSTAPTPRLTEDGLIG